VIKEAVLWKDEYERKKVTPKQIKDIIRPGSRVYIETGCSEPQYLVKELILENRELSDVEIYTSIPLRAYTDFGGEYGSRFRIKSFFISSNVSSAFEEGSADHMPLSSIGLIKLFSQGYIRINTAMIQLGLPDEHGFMSLGITVDLAKIIIEKADIVIAQVNSSMPRSFGDGFVHVSKVDYIIEKDEPLLEIPQDDQDSETIKVGENIARLIDDGSTIQVGFGRIPNSALLALKNKKDLGVHSEIITDEICDLMNSGVITNVKKDIDNGKTVASFCIGTSKVFDFVNDNPSVEMKNLSYTTDPQNILAHKKMVAINGAVEIDLTGQSCVGMSDNFGYFGALGHATFNRTAMLTEGGKGIIALRSTSRDGKLSRIVPEFSDSKIGIITTQADIHYVVTEFGHADLFGKSIRERSLALITIAHPKFRSWLLKEAKRLNYVYKDQFLPPDNTLYPEKYEKELFMGGERLTVRPIKVTDERGIQDLFYAMSRHDKFYRFLRNVSALHHQQAQPLVSSDYINSMALVVTHSSLKEEGIIAVAHIARETKEDMNDVCEFAAMVHPNWQNIGIGTFLLKYILGTAYDLGFTKMIAYIWEDNIQMLKVFGKTDLPLKQITTNRVCTAELDLSFYKREQS
jgi:acyl-CoA hydrolase/GNAT superfamily N-acetyltransferase